jgi:hypothetical protein
MDLNFLNTLNNQLLRLVGNFITVSLFWTVAIYLFKPEFINEATYIQIALTFCLNLIWFIYFFFVIIYLNVPKKPALIFEETSLLAIAILCVFILIGYYYSDCFTKFLQRTFLYSLIFLPMSILFAILKDKFNGKAKEQKEKNGL